MKIAWNSGEALLLILCLCAGCVFDSDPDVKGTGTVRFIELEGGFYGIVADDGRKYDPINLSEGFREDGLRVKFEANIREDLSSIHMWGTLVELTKIERL
jgi:hypothetical protein